MSMTRKQFAALYIRKRAGIRAAADFCARNDIPLETARAWLLSK